MATRKAIFPGIGAGIALLLQPAAVHAAEPPGSVRDLVGARASSGEASLEARGFTFISGATRNGQKLSYWWNGSAKECIRAATDDGAFVQIVSAPKQDCGQRGGDNGAALAVGVGAAALIGAIALSHKSHNHDSGRHYDDVTRESHYERGYRDGLYHQSYHNYDRSDAYTEGYENGARSRGEETSYRNGNYYGGGYGSHVSIHDLRGADRGYAVGQLLRRGFIQRDNKKTDDGRYATYWREASRQCVIVVSHSGRIDSIESTSEDTCRRW
ncbi:hypothetical protein [Sphingomonas swuensis]